MSQIFQWLKTGGKGEGEGRGKERGIMHFLVPDKN
jgi:hypothetical protein